MSSLTFYNPVQPITFLKKGILGPLQAGAEKPLLEAVPAALSVPSDTRGTSGGGFGKGSEKGV